MYYTCTIHYYTYTILDIYYPIHACIILYIHRNMHYAIHTLYYALYCTYTVLYIHTVQYQHPKVMHNTKKDYAVMYQSAEQVITCTSVIIRFG